MKKVTSTFAPTWGRYVPLRDQLLSELEPTNLKDQIAVGLFTRINSIAEDSWTLIKAERTASLPSLLRLCMESFVDLRCIIDVDGYTENIRNAWIKQEIQYYSNYRSNNPYFGSETENKAKERLSDLKKVFKSEKALRIYERFKKAECIDVYHTVYNHLCRHAHGNLDSIFYNHFTTDGFVLNKTATKNGIHWIVAFTLNTAIGSAVEISHYFKSESESLLNELLKETNKKSESLK